SCFNGSVDEVRVWNAALSQSTIANWMNEPIVSTHPNYASLAGYWKFDEGTGSTTADSSGNNHAGTLVNSPTWITSFASITTPASTPTAIATSTNTPTATASSTATATSTSTNTATSTATVTNTP